jgi:hypothetical protein
MEADEEKETWVYQRTKRCKAIKKFEKGKRGERNRCLDATNTVASKCGCAAMGRERSETFALTHVIRSPFRPISSVFEK